jgi:hypothetical protein
LSFLGVWIECAVNPGNRIGDPVALGLFDSAENVDGLVVNRFQPFAEQRPARIWSLSSNTSEYF